MATDTLRPLLVVMVICQGPIMGCHGDRSFMLRVGHVRQQNRKGHEDMEIKSSDHLTAVGKKTLILIKSLTNVCVSMAVMLDLSIF